MRIFLRHPRSALGASIGTVVLSLGPLLYGQSSAEFSGPRMGYIYDAQTHAIRPVLGITGSARIGDPLDTGFEMKEAVPIPGRDVVIAFLQDDAPELISLGSDSVETRKLDYVLPNPSMVTLSPRGSSAAVHYAAAARILIVNGLPKEPRLKVSIDISNSYGTLRHLAINDEGTFLVAAFSDESHDVLLGWNGSDAPRLLTIASRISGLAFLADDVIVADSAADEVFAIRNIDSTAVRVPLMVLSHGLSETILTTLSERHEIYVGNAGSGIISVLDADGKLLRQHNCACAVSGFYPMNNEVLRLTERLDQPIIILDAGSSPGRTAFIPALTAALDSLELSEPH